MASKSCTKSYNRKLNNSITSCNIQFDKLFRESNSRPSAAKSAGTVGKWGITSFTSIRSSSISERRSSDIRGTYATKRLKLEYVNQKTHDKDIIPQSKKEHTSDSNKPKKFFKSRNASSNTERTQSTAKFSESVDQDYDKTCSTERLYCKRDKSNAVSSILELPGREETKPPIVLRICKGTAKLICSDEPDTESYQVSKISTIPEMNNTIGSNTQADHIFRYESRNLSQLPVKFDLRATRNRSKNLKYDVIPNSTSTSNPENSGLSLTLRKSVTDSEETFNSHYDVIKTRSIHGKSNKVDKDLRNSEKSLPKTKDVEQKNELVEENYHDALNQGFGPTDRISARINNEVYNNSYVNAHSDCENVDERNITPLTEIIKINETELVSLGNNAEDKTKNVDNEWSSSSDDSESASNNEHSDSRTQNQCLTSRSEPSIMTKNKTTIKPTITKKGSIFKTRSTGAASINKRHALYKHKWSDSEKELKLLNVDSKKVEADILNLTPTSSNSIDYDAEIKNSHLTRITTFSENETNLSHEIESTVTSIRCDKKVKGFYTVVKNVKKAHQIQESGEFQEFNDDVDYIMDTLRDNNPNATRCLSAIRLASKCMAPAFRMHVRAHGTVAKFFKALHDATADQSLALCTATVMFVLSQDRLAMDLDRDCLELMLSLLESDASHKNALNDCGLSHAELLKNREKVRQLCADIQEQGHAQHLNLDNITSIRGLQSKEIKMKLVKIESPTMVMKVKKWLACKAAHVEAKKLQCK
ncbi:uncharacterized protein LOC106638702 [Copidosoma floridanum]|uniref:uncharacterized protein LOC106638702 n=1 Tax=Copidosoma floridanum TaxID=29053 RepID=UPI0006C95B31|nr:uncharacterized protein LOC106638702 [Copidosoma floridanum]